MRQVKVISSAEKIKIDTGHIYIHGFESINYKCKKSPAVQSTLRGRRHCYGHGVSKTEKDDQVIIKKAVENGQSSARELLDSLKRHNHKQISAHDAITFGRCRNQMPQTSQEVC